MRKALLRQASAVGRAMVVFVGLVSLEAGAAPLRDLGFETPVVGAGRFQYNALGSAWTFDRNTGVSGNGSGFTFGNPAAPEGSQVAFLQSGISGGTSEVGTFFQVFDQTELGTIQFFLLAAQRNSGPRGTLIPNQPDFNVLIDSDLIGYLRPTTTTYLPYQTTPYLISPGSHTLRFVGVNSGGSTDTTAFVDNITFSFTPLAIPEPETNALLLAGLGMLAVSVRRRIREGCTKNSGKGKA